MLQKISAYAELIAICDEFQLAIDFPAVADGEEVDFGIDQRVRGRWPSG